MPRTPTGNHQVPSQAAQATATWQPSDAFSKALAVLQKAEEARRLGGAKPLTRTGIPQAPSQAAQANKQSSTITLHQANAFPNATTENARRLAGTKPQAASAATPRLGTAAAKPTLTSIPPSQDLLANLVQTSSSASPLKAAIPELDTSAIISEGVCDLQQSASQVKLQQSEEEEKEKPLEVDGQVPAVSPATNVPGIVAYRMLFFRYHPAQLASNGTASGPQPGHLFRTSP